MPPTVPLKWPVPRSTDIINWARNYMTWPGVNTQLRIRYSMGQYRLYKRQSINCRRGFCCLLKSQTYDLRWVTFSDKNCTAIAGYHTLCGSGTIVGHLGKNSTHGLFAGGRVSSTLCSCCGYCHQSSTAWEVWALDTLWVLTSYPQIISNAKARDGISPLNINRMISGKKSLSAKDVSAKHTASHAEWHGQSINGMC